MTVDPLGPAFISYRQSDGRELAVSLAWALRAIGVPVWQDQSDLPPGDTELVLARALSDGLSSAILLITPELELSTVVKNLEAPALIDVADSNHGSFVLALASVVLSPTSHGIDYDAPDKLLSKPLGTLKRFDQKPAHTLEERAIIAAALGSHRLQQLGGQIKDAGHLRLDVQTRVAPQASAVQAPLVMRFRLPEQGQRVPPAEAFHDLAGATAHLLDLVANACNRSGGVALRLTGGAHLSVAAALGVALPTTLLGRVEVLDQDGQLWTGGGPGESDPSTVRTVGHSTGTPASGRKAVACYIDLVPNGNDDAYATFLREHSHLAAWKHLRASADGAINPEHVGPLVAALAGIVRQLSADFGSAELHLLLRTPWPVAFLLGRQLNTLDITLYEWTGPEKNRYQSVLRLPDGGRILHVLAPR